MTAASRRIVLRAGLAVGASLAAASCARIPLSSGIGATAVDRSADGSAPYVRPRPPARDASPAAIVAGFVQAGVGADDDYAVARSYLTPAARRAWQPRAGVTIYSSDQEVTTSEGGDGSVSLALQAVGQVDEIGVRTVLVSPSQRRLDVTLAQVGGQWRISDPPAGVFLSEQVFEVLFTAGRLFFVDSRGRHLVPDVRWVAAQDQAVALLRHLGAGPAPFLRQAVRTAVPGALAEKGATAGTAADGAVTIALPAAVHRLEPEQRRTAVAQIAATVQSLPLLGEVRITSDGHALAASAGSGPSRPLVGHRGIGAAAGGGIVALAEAKPGAAPSQLVPSLAGQVLRDPALSPGGDLAAALSSDRTTVLISTLAADAAPRSVGGGGLLVPPRVDDAGWVWTAHPDRSGTLLALSGGSAATDATLSAPWLAGRAVTWLDVAVDATRLLVVSDDGGRTRMDLCGIVRDVDGVPLALSDPVSVVAPLTAVSEATWYDEASAVLLGTGEDGRQSAVVADLSGAVQRLPTPPDGTTRLAGTATAGVLYCSDESSSLQRSDGTTWTPVSIAVHDPSFS